MKDCQRGEPQQFHNQEGGSFEKGVNLYHKAEIIKTVLYWPQNKLLDATE